MHKRFKYVVFTEHEQKKMHCKIYMLIIQSPKFANKQQSQYTYSQINIQ